jgi:protein-disulfide isomerase
VVKATPTKSRTPFYAAMLVVLLGGGGFIAYKMGSNSTPTITLDSTAALPTAEGYLRGRPDAAVTIIEFGDFECPQCGRFATIAEPDLRARIVDAGLANFKFFDWPISEIHKNTLAASLAASCAADQGKFWEMHDAIFAGQDEWNGQATSNPRKFMDSYAEKVGLDMKTYASCFDSQKNLARIQANKKLGTDRGVNGTPTIFIGNQSYPSNISVDEIKRIVDSLNAAAPKPATADTGKK